MVIEESPAGAAAAIGAGMHAIVYAPGATQSAMAASGVAEGVYEVTVTATVTTKLKDRTLFLIEAKQAGIFEIRNVPEDQLQGILSIVCPQMIAV